MDAKTLFDTKLPQIIADNPAKAQEVGAIYLFKITGQDGGIWTVNLKGAPGVSAGDAGDAECTIEIANEDLATVIENPDAGMQLFFDGRLKVEGDPMLATKVQEVFKLTL